MESTCKQCTHYVQHYGLFEGKLRPLFCGHCLLNHKKSRKPYMPVCEQFVQDTPVEDKMVTKEYLTRALLQHILDMELWKPQEG